MCCWDHQRKDSAAESTHVSGEEISADQVWMKIFPGGNFKIEKSDDVHGLARFLVTTYNEMERQREKISRVELVVPDHEYPFREDLFSDASGNVDPTYQLLPKRFFWSTFCRWPETDSLWRHFGRRFCCWLAGLRSPLHSFPMSFWFVPYFIGNFEYLTWFNLSSFLNFSPSI